jgi:hypothetical protein
VFTAVANKIWKTPLFFRHIIHSIYLTSHKNYSLPRLCYCHGLPFRQAFHELENAHFAAGYHTRLFNFTTS